MKKTTTAQVVRKAALLLTLVFLVGVLAACVGSPPSEAPEETTKYQWTVDALPQPPKIEIPGTVAPYVDNDVIEPDYSTRYAASSESDKYHRPSCHYVDQILSYNLIYFNSESSARRAGYTPCSICDP